MRRWRPRATRVPRNSPCSNARARTPRPPPTCACARSPTYPPGPRLAPARARARARPPRRPRHHRRHAAELGAAGARAMIAVVDYGAGNLRSVLNALRAIGQDARVATEPEHLNDASAIVLPG